MRCETNLCLPGYITCEGNKTADFDVKHMFQNI